MKKVAVVREQFPGERRVALLPENVEKLNAAGYEVLIEEGAGEAAGIPDQLYADAGAKVTTRSGLMGADVLVQVRSLGANAVNGDQDLELVNAGQLVIGMCDPLGNAEAIEHLATVGASQIALEMVPRITRAQSMDVLSSMATIAGYRAVLHAAYQLPRMFPLNMTAAGTLQAARVFIIGAGVAGLQAAATAKRLGAVVSAYDVRPDCREQVESVGARFVELELETDDAEDAGGYAREQTEDFLMKQRAFMAEVASEHDIVITTAAIPGRQSPLLITSEAVAGMDQGSVIIDLAAERGGNCAETKADETVLVDGVTILGPTNLPAEIPYHASQMFGNNVTNLLLHLISDEGEIELDLEDDIVAGCLVSKNGEIVNERIGGILGVEVAVTQATTEPEGEDEPQQEVESNVNQEPTAEGVTEAEIELSDEDFQQDDVADSQEIPLVEEEDVEKTDITEAEEEAEEEVEEEVEEEAEEEDEDYSDVEAELQEVDEALGQFLTTEESDTIEDVDSEEEEEEVEEEEEYEEAEEDDEEELAEDEEVDEDHFEYEELEDEEDALTEEDDESVYEEEYEEDEADEEEEYVEYEVEESDELEVDEESEEESEEDAEAEEESEEDAESEEESEEDAAEEYELEDYDAAADYSDDDDEPDYDFSDYEEE